MRNLMRKLRTLFRKNKKTLYLRSKSRIIIGRAFQRLDQSKFLGENVPTSVLSHFSKDGV